MYDLKCDKEFNEKLDIPDFLERYLSLLHSDKKNIIIIKETFSDPTFRYRGYNVFQSMRNNGKYNVNCFLVEELHYIYEFLDKIDLVILQRAIWSFDLESFINVLKVKNIKIIYDMDDLIYNTKYIPKYLDNIGDYRENTVNSFFSVSKRYELIAGLCDGYIVTTQNLFENMKKDFNKPVWVFHNYLNLEQEKISEEIVNLKKDNYNDDKFLIGYFSGSYSHKRDLEIVESAILKLMKKYDDIYLKIVGYMDLDYELEKLKDEGRIIFSDFVSFEELQYEIGKVDLNIIPLQKHEFNECKSELKYFEASIVDTITCATDNEVYKSIINDGVDGYLSDEISWYDKIEYIYLNHNNLENIVLNAKTKCLKEYGNKNQEDRLEKMYDEILEA